MSIKIESCEFLYSVPRISIMKEHRAECAFFGRSNVGKSSLINSLCQQKAARTSKTPGRTKHAVVLEVLVRKNETKKFATLVDLPGFGYANMSQTEAQECEDLIFSYIQYRPNIKAIFILLDIRREPDEREKRLAAFARMRNIELHFVLTKIDKITLSQRKPAKIRLQRLLDIDDDHLHMHSLSIGTSSEELRGVIFALAEK